MKTVWGVGAAALAGAAALGFGAMTAAAQPAATQGSSASSNLPAVVVDSPQRRAAVAKPSPQRRATRAAVTRSTRRTANQPPPSPPPAAIVENPRGPVNGYVAERSSSATKTDTPIHQTPQAISVIGAEQIRDQKPAKLDEVLRYAPGVVGGTFGADTRFDWFLIRGFPAQQQSLFLDGLQLPAYAYAQWKLPAFNLERLEVLRGPSAVLYGGSSQAGIVNAVSKLPQAEPIRYIEAGVNNYGNRYVGFDMGGPIATAPENGQLMYRLVGQARGGDTQTDYVRDDNYFIAPSVTWKPDAQTTFTLMAMASRANTNSQNFLPYVGTVVDAPFGKISTKRFTGEPSNDAWNLSQQMIGYQFEKHLDSGLTFRQNARYAHIDSTVAQLYGLGYATTAADANLARGNFYAHNAADLGQIDNQLEARFATGALSHTVLFGVDLKYYGIDDYQAFSGASSLNLLNPVYTPTMRTTAAPYQNAYLTQKQVGIYLQDQIKLDRFTLVLSGRNDWAKTASDSRIGASYARDDSKATGRVGLIYNFDNGIAPYVSYATSYNPVIGINFTTASLYAPETGQQAEVGVKFKPAGFDGHFGVALFDLKRQNVLTTDPNNVLLSVQSGEVTSRGVELEAVANVMPGLKTTFAYTNYDIFVSKDLNSSLIGKVPTNTPSWFTSAWADYTIQTGQLRGFGFGGGVRYVGPSFADNINTLSVPSYALVDAAIHYEWDNWRLALNVTNIADKIYVGSCQSATACFYGDRRRAIASIAYKW